MRRLNDWLALRITNAVGTMWCAYLFALLALWGLPAALRPGGVGFVQWLAQTFLQLVLLSVILVGQRVQSSQIATQAAHLERMHHHLLHHHHEESASTP